MTKHTSAAAAALSVLIASSAAMAGSTAGTPFDVTITVDAGCNITTDLLPIDWGGVQGTLGKPGPISRPVRVICTNGATYGFHLESLPANNYSSGSFNMLNQKDNITLLPYTVRVGSSTATPLTNVAPATLSNSSQGTEQTYTFYFGLSDWGPKFPLGLYKDTLTLYVDY